MKNTSDTKINLIETTDASQPGKSFIAETIINSSVSDVFRIVSNYAAYPSFVPMVKKVHVRKDNKHFSVVDVHLNLPLKIVKKFRLKVIPEVNEGAYKVSWEKMPWQGLKESNTIADTKGYWLLRPQQGDKQATMVKYVVYTDPGKVPFGFGWIVNLVSKDGIPAIIEAVREKAKQ